MNINQFFELIGEAAAGLSFGRDDSPPPTFKLPAAVSRGRDGTELVYALGAGALQEPADFRELRLLVARVNAGELLGCKPGHLQLMRAQGGPAKLSITFRLSAVPLAAELQRRDFSPIQTIITRAKGDNGEAN